MRFTKPLAMLYGTFGKGREAVRTLERYLEEEQEDRDAYLYAVQWIYTVHAGGAVVHNRAEDLKRARDYADAYASARGPQLALVRQWVDYLEKEALSSSAARVGHRGCGWATGRARHGLSEPRPDPRATALSHAYCDDVFAAGFRYFEYHAM